MADKIGPHTVECICGKIANSYHAEDERGNCGWYVECKNCKRRTYNEDREFQAIREFNQGRVAKEGGAGL